MGEINFGDFSPKKSWDPVAYRASGHQNLLFSTDGEGVRGE